MDSFCDHQAGALPGCTDPTLARVSCSENPVHALRPIDCLPQLQGRLLPDTGSSS